MTFKDLAARVRRHVRRHRKPIFDTLTLESCPLHTEKPEWAAKAPAQVDAACKRGADVIAFTEVHTALAHELARVCAQNGYAFFHDKSDAAVAWKANLDGKASNVAVADSPAVMTRLDLWWNGSHIVVFALHWYTAHPTHMAIRAAQTRALIEEMGKASAGSALAFYMADSNPIKPVSDPASEPRHSLDAAGLPEVWVELNEFPAGVGVTTIGRNVKDTRVHAVSAVLHDALGSDHRPGTATYSVRRLRTKG